MLYYLHTDHLGSASLTTDASGTIHARQRYFPYGETRWSSGTLPTDRQFTGQRREVALGIYDYKARFYSPRLGRFLSADTLVPNPAKPQLFNRYSYAGNNPVLYNDPDGHCGPLCWAAIGLTLFGMSLLVTADTRLPPEQAPSPVQGLVGWTSIGLGFGAAFAPEAIAAAGTAACGDGDCTNEVQMGIEAGQKILDAASADGDPTNDIQSAVRLYRAVSETEFQQIMETGRFQETALSASGKYFATTLTDAQNWGELLFGDASYRIVTVEFPTEAVSQFYYNLMDGMPAYFATMEQLNLLIQNIKEVIP